MEEPLITQAPGEPLDPATAGEARASDEPVRSPWRLAAKIAGVALLAGLLALLAWGTLAAGRGNSLVAKIASGKRPAAPEFDLGVLWRKDETWPPDAIRALTDGKLALEELRGYPVVLNFWASWCIPCRDEAPILAAGARKHRGKVAFVGIDVQDLRSDALGFLRKYKVNYVSVRDRGDKAYRAYGLTGVPETYFVDTRGRIVAHSLGALSTRTLEQGIAAISRPGGPVGQLGRGPHITR